MRVSRLPREAAGYVMLRRRGYSINNLAAIFGRSTSMIYRILKNNGLAGTKISGAGFVRYKLLNAYDMRKSGALHKDLKGLFSGLYMVNLFQAWADFMAGEGERPP